MANTDHPAQGIIKQGLKLNLCSGFSLPLVIFHPLYTPCLHQILLPDSGAYTNAVVEATGERFPHYDDVFSPVAELARIVGTGGWSGKWNVPRSTRLMLGPNGVRVFVSYIF